MSNHYVKKSVTKQPLLYEEKEQGVVPVVICEVVSDISEIPQLTKAESSNLPLLYTENGAGIFPVMRLVIPNFNSGAVNNIEKIDGGTPEISGTVIYDGGTPENGGAVTYDGGEP